MRLVVDSSVVVATCLAGGKLGPLAPHELRAPAHLAAEVTSVIREQAFRREIPTEQAVQALQFLPALGIRYEAPGSFAAAAFQIAADLGWAKTYDAEYVALAVAIHAPLVTLDGRLRRRVANLVRVIGPLEI